MSANAPDFGEPGAGAFEEIPLAAYEDEAVSTHSHASRVVIQLASGQFHVAAEAAEQLVADDIYVRAQRLARLGTAPELAASLQADIARDVEQRVIVPVTAEYLRRQLNMLAEFQKFSRREKGLYRIPSG